jgi:leukotriene-A4 hydrolase
MTVVLPLLLAASVSGDAHSLANPERVRPTHIALDLTVDFGARRLEGAADLDLAYADGPRPDVLALDSQGLEIAKVVDPATGQGLAFALESPVPVLGQRLSITLGQPAPGRVRIEYRTGPGATALQWLDPQQTTSGRLPFVYTQSEAIHARSWIPCSDSPAVRVTYDATIRVPPGMVAVMSAEHGTDDTASGVYRFHMGQSIPPYLIALAAGEIAFKAVGPRTGVYAEPAVVDRAASEFADMERMLTEAEALDGPYRWGRWDVLVLPPSFPYGGMENPRLTFATPTILAGDRSLVNVVAHELAHSWSGNLVTNATWGDFWLNEGLTSYGERRIVERLYGREFADMEWLLALRALRKVVADPRIPAADTRLAIDLAGRDPDDGPPATIPYEKGACFIQVLEEQMGRQRLDTFLQGYFARNAFTSMSSARFLDELRRDLFRGDESAWRRARVEEWVKGTGVPENVVVPESRRFDAAEAAAARFAKDGALVDVHADWTTAEWQTFLSGLPHPLTEARMKAIDSRFHLSRSGNSEILFAWLRHVVWSAYSPDYPALEDFLMHVGRQKFLRPLYKEMMEGPTTREMAKAVYAKARARYHPIAAAAVDAVVK